MGWVCLVDAQTTEEISTPGITIVSPVQGTIVRPGGTVTVKVRIDPTIPAESVSITFAGWDDLDLTTDDEPPFEFTLPIPQERTGPIRIVCFAHPKRGGLLGGSTVTVKVVPSDTPVSIDVEASGALYASTRPLNRQEHIIVRGTFADGKMLDLSGADLGSRYTTSDPKVVVVERDGTLSAGIAGRAFIKVENGGLTEWFPIYVYDGLTERLPPLDVTDQVSIAVSKAQYDPSSDMYTQQVTVTNVSDSAILYPVELVVTDLPSGVEIRNRSGTTRIVEPIGSSRVRVRATNTRHKLIAPGDTLTTTFEINKRTDLPITHTLRMFSGPHL